MNGHDYDPLYGRLYPGQCSSPQLLRASSDNITTLTTFSASALAPGALAASVGIPTAVSMDYLGGGANLPPYEQLYGYYRPPPSSSGYAMPPQVGIEASGLVNYPSAITLGGIGDYAGNNSFGASHHVLLAGPANNVATNSPSVTLQPQTTQQILLSARQPAQVEFNIGGSNKQHSLTELGSSRFGNGKGRGKSELMKSDQIALLGHLESNLKNRKL